jgi:excinuclease ABC subunit C
LKTDQVKDVNLSELFKEIRNTLGFDKEITRIECFDVSHSSGTLPVGSCVVFGEKGKIKKDYRLYNISEKLGGNDIASMEELIRRRFKPGNTLQIPDLIIIDGGSTQLGRVNKIISSMNLKNILMIAITKGFKRKLTNDTIHFVEKKAIEVNKFSSSHLFLQRVRDEAHRFAIDNLKKKRVKLLTASSLKEINGIGGIRQKVLIRYFGSLKGISDASLSELRAVPGIGRNNAVSVYEALKK